MKFNEFIKKDIDFINSNANWNDEQKQIFDYLVKDKYTDFGIYTELNMSESKYYKVKKQIKKKITRIIADS